MILGVGLGNPGPQYVLNRHNVGFMAVNALAEAYSFGVFKRHKDSFVTEGLIDNQKIALIKPFSFINRSGIPLQDYAHFFKIPLDHIIVFHDDLDIAPGKIKIKQGGGAGGHNGLRSIDAHMGNAYWRVRIGIGHPGHRDDVSNYVLQNFSKSDTAWLDPLLHAITAEVSWLLKLEMPRFLTEIARRLS